MTSRLANRSTVQGVGTKGTNNTAPGVQKATRDLGRLLLQSSQTGWHPRRGFFILQTAAARPCRHTQPGTRGLEGSSHRPSPGDSMQPPSPTGTAHTVPAGCGLQGTGVAPSAGEKVGWAQSTEKGQEEEEEEHRQHPTGTVPHSGDALTNDTWPTDVTQCKLERNTPSPCITLPGRSDTAARGA